MGLRFRKSITIMPGVKLNFGKTGASVSVGTKGLHASLHTSGKLTTTASLPGTGISYVKTKNVKKLAKDAKAAAEKKKSEKEEKKAAEAAAAAEALAAGEAEEAVISAEEDAVIPVTPEEAAAMEAAFRPAQLTDDALRGIHKSFDETADWLEFAESETPPDPSFDEELWAYYHAQAPAILDGDIDAYLQVIDDVGPLDDLLDYGGRFQFGTDSASLMEVEFTVNEQTLEAQRAEKNVIAFYDLMQDFVCSTCIRVARDMFALLPVADVVVHAVLGEDTVVSVRFDRETMGKIKFGYVDPSDVMERFTHNMDFRQGRGFAPVERIDTAR